MRQPIDSNKEWGYKYVGDFSAIARGASQSVSITTDATTDFEVLCILACFNYSSSVTFVSRSNIVGIDTTGGNDNTAQMVKENLTSLAKLYREVSSNLAEVCGAGLHHVTLAFQSDDRLWQSAPVRADLYTGEPGKLLIEPSPPLLKPRTTLQITAYNNLPASIMGVSTLPIDGQVVLVGKKRNRAGSPT